MTKNFDRVVARCNYVIRSIREKNGLRKPPSCKSFSMVWKWKSREGIVKYIIFAGEGSQVYEFLNHLRTPDQSVWGPGPRALTQNSLLKKFPNSDKVS